MSSSSSVSSHLVSLAQSWNHQLVSRDRQIAHEESREAITHDSISCLPFDRPLVDPCGHTFDRETIKQFKKLSTNTVECPISRRAVRIDQFTPNLYAENVLGYFGEESSRATNGFSRICSCATCAAQSSSSSASTSTTSTAQQGPATLESLMEQMRLSREESRLSETRILTQVGRLETRLGIMGRQINNLVGMDYCDRLVSLVKCNHFKTVRDRGLTEEEKTRVNT